MTYVLCALAGIGGGLLALQINRMRHHGYLSTGCLHGDAVILPDGRTGHQYCQSETGHTGSKIPATCKFCAAPCRCRCHKAKT